MGTLQVQQGVVPLNLSRDIDRLGEARPSGARRFAITSVRLGGDSQTLRPVRGEFAPGQLFDLTDDERLAAPSFEEMDAGVAFGDDTYSVRPVGGRALGVRLHRRHDRRRRQRRPSSPSRCRPTTGTVMVLVGLGAAARAVVRRRRHPLPVRRGDRRRR